MPANYNCLLFDVDGTLLDFAAAERESISGTLEAFGLPADEAACQLFSTIDAAMWTALERGEIKKEQLMVRRFTDLLKALSAKGDAIRMNNEYMSRFANAATPYPGAVELLEELAEFATLAVASNGSERVQFKRLEKAGLLPYFDEVFVSEKIGATKPSPKFFSEALRRLGIHNKARVLVIGDSLTADVKGGQNAKLDTCWVNFAGAENTGNITPTYMVESYAQLKLVAVGEEELRFAAMREKRHIV